MNVQLDHNAGAPLRGQAADAMAAAVELLAAGGNPSSPHSHGRALRKIVEDAREAVAALAGADRMSVVFVSGATEAANTVLASGWDFVLHSSLEHDCVRHAVREAGQEIPVTRDGRIDLDRLEEALSHHEGNGLVAVLAACGETGVVQPVEEARLLAEAHGACFYCDATQLLGRRPFSFSDLGAEYAGFTSAKIGGPPGVGALLVREDAGFLPLLRGGGQEGRRRAGTENVIGISGFGAAAGAATGEDWSGIGILRDRMEAALAEVIPGACFYGREALRLPNTSCFSIPGWTAERLVIALDLEGYSIGAGSACSSGKAEPGRAPAAMGYGVEAAEAAVRVSLGHRTRAEEVDGFVAALSARLESRMRRAA